MFYARKCSLSRRLFKTLFWILRKAWNRHTHTNTIKLHLGPSGGREGRGKEVTLPSTKPGKGIYTSIIRSPQECQDMLENTVRESSEASELPWLGESGKQREPIHHSREDDPRRSLRGKEPAFREFVTPKHYFIFPNRLYPSRKPKISSPRVQRSNVGF